jgi:hypothetical protein
VPTPRYQPTAADAPATRTPASSGKSSGHNLMSARSMASMTAYEVWNILQDKMIQMKKSHRQLTARAYGPGGHGLCIRRPMTAANSSATRNQVFGRSATGGAGLRGLAKCWPRAWANSCGWLGGTPMIWP